MYEDIRPEDGENQNEPPFKDKPEGDFSPGKLLAESDAARNHNEQLKAANDPGQDQKSQPQNADQPGAESYGSESAPSDAEPPEQFISQVEPSNFFAKRIYRFRLWFGRLSKKQKAMFLGFVAGLAIFSGWLVWRFVFYEEPAPPPPPPVVKKVEPPKPTTAQLCLGGFEVPIKKKDQRLTGIMIENSTAARPQSGLYQAEVVYEAIAEGGITRFLALFQKNKPGYVGPVRSLRPYYLDFLKPYNAGIAHAGGSAAALARVRSGPFKDIEAFQNPGYFNRIPSRFAPHNLYTNRGSLIDLQKEKGWKKGECKGFARKKQEDVEPAKVLNAKSIDLAISSANYNVHYDYHAKTNSYKRSMGGAAHIDERANKQINPKVVVALVMSHKYEGIYSVYGTKGAKRAYIFQNGKVHVGKWSKRVHQSQFKFKNDKKDPILLNPGKTWVSVVRKSSDVSFSGDKKPQKSTGSGTNSR